MAVSDGIPQKLRFKPGFNKNDTEYQAQGKFINGDKVRFVNGRPEKMGGWQTLTAAQTYLGTAREALIWADLDGNKYYAVGTNTGVYVYGGGTYYDITPIRYQATETSAFNTFSGETRTKVSVAAHGAAAGDYVEFPTGVTTGAGVSVNGRYVITSANTNNFTIDVSSANGSTRTKKGKSTLINFLLETGKADNVATTGYGAGTYGSGTYGSGSSSSLSSNMRLWSFDNWGEDLLALPRNGKLYIWDESDTVQVRCSTIPNAPTRSNFLFVADDSRQVVLCGTSMPGGNFDPLGVRWSSTENYSEWDPAVTNAAGSTRLNSGSYIVGGVKGRKQTVLFTDDAAHSFTFIGPPYYFEATKLADSCGGLSPNGAISVNGIVYWWGPNGFYKYDGVVSQLNCDISNVLFEAESSLSLNFDQKEKIYAGFNSRHSEILWFYPKKDSIENDRYVIYNIKEDIFYDGSLNRTTWTDSTLFENPLATGVSTTTYEHEVGFDNDGSTLRSFIDTGYIEIENGGELVFVDKFIPDFKDLSGNNMKVSFRYKKYPQEATESVKGPYLVRNNTDKINPHVRARQVALTFDVSAVGSYYKFGDHRLQMQPDGER